jgi:hypothetical protein
MGHKETQDENIPNQVPPRMSRPLALWLGRGNIGGFRKLA